MNHDNGTFPGSLPLPERSSEHNNRGLFAHLAGEIDVAAREYRAAIDLDPANAAALSNYGFLLAQRGQHGQASQWLERAIAAQPDYATAHNNLGNSRPALRDVESAIAAHR